MTKLYPLHWLEVVPPLTSRGPEPYGEGTDLISSYSRQELEPGDIANPPEPGELDPGDGIYCGCHSRGVVRTYGPVPWISVTMTVASGSLGLAKDVMGTRTHIRTERNRSYRDRERDDRGGEKAIGVFSLRGGQMSVYEGVYDSMYQILINVLHTGQSAR